MIRSKPLFFKQETRYSCGPACLRMVLSALGLDVQENKLRQLADCTPFGTDAFQLVEAARMLGFPATRKHTFASIDDLTRLIDGGFFPIVYVDLWPIRGGISGQYHSLVVEAATFESVVVLDPLEGEHSIPVGDFLAAWQEMHCLTIVVSALRDWALPRRARAVLNGLVNVGSIQRRRCRGNWALEDIIFA